MSLNTTPATWVTGTVVTAAQLNLEVRDALTGLQAAWTAYTPAWTATTTNPTIGNGTITGAYLQMGKTIVGMWAKVVAGSTTTFGSGFYSLSLPVAPHANWAAPLLTRYKIGGTIFTGQVHAYSGSTANQAADVSAAGGALATVSTTVPGTFASASELHMTGSYQAA